MTPPATAARRSRAELRELVLEAAVDLIYREGLELRPSSISYSKVFAHLSATQGVRVTRASVHERIWASQAEFQDEVLRRALEWDSSATVAMLREAQSSFSKRVIHEDPAEAANELREVVRVLGPAFMTSSESEDQWSSWVATALSAATQRGDSSLKTEAELAARRTYEEQTTLFAEVAGQMITSAHRVADETVIGDEDLLSLAAMASIAVADGLELRRRLAGPLPTIRVPSGKDGATQEWDLYGLVMWTLVDAWTRFMEEAPVGDEGAEREHP